MRLRNTRQFWRQCQSVALSTLAIALLTLATYKLHLNATTVVLFYVLVVVLQSLAGGSVAAVIVAVVAAAFLDFFFLPPRFTFRIDDPLNVVSWLVFLIVALVITRLVTRLREEAHAARLHGTEADQLYEIAMRLLLLTPDKVGGRAALKVVRDVLGADAVCLFDASTLECSVDGISQHDLAECTRQAYIFGKDTDDAACRVFVRCLRIGNPMTGAIGVEGLADPQMISPALPVLVAAALERAHTFRRASHETAAAQAEIFRTAILDALAHEFKTPLATILALTGGIKESRRLEPEQEEMADMIEFEVSRLSRLTTRLLRTARLDQEELKPRLKPIDIVPFVERVVYRYLAHSNERRVAVTSCSTAVEVSADRQLLDLALTQLLDNAFKYSTPASTITVSVEAEEGFITTSVRNEGDSIAPDEQDRIFDRFYRGARVRNLVSGTGLGLYVARKIAAAHGGSLDLINDGPDKGVVFCLKLPMLNHGCDKLATSH
jgi:two-component system sensor histidine kinase KdpD